jgi:hypothetical protein
MARADLLLFSRAGRHLLQCSVSRFGVCRATQLASFSLLLDESGNEPRYQILLPSRERDGLLEDTL